MHLVRPQYVLAASLALMAQQATALVDPSQELNALHSNSIGEVVSKGALGKRQASGNLVKGLNVLGNEVDPNRESSQLFESIRHVTAPGADKRQFEGPLIAADLPKNADEFAAVLQSIHLSPNRRQFDGSPLAADLPKNADEFAAALKEIQALLPRNEQQGFLVAGHKVPTNTKDLTSFVQHATNPKMARREQQNFEILTSYNSHTDSRSGSKLRRSTGLDLDVDRKPLPQFAIDTVRSAFKRDFSTSDLKAPKLDELSTQQIGPLAEAAAQKAVPVALQPVQSELAAAVLGYKVANALAHETGTDVMTKNAVDQGSKFATDTVHQTGADAVALDAFQQGSDLATDAVSQVSQLGRRESVDLTSLQDSDLSRFQSMPMDTIKLAAPIAGSKTSGYISTAKGAVEVAQQVSNMAGVPQAIESTGAFDVIQDSTAELGKMTPKMPRSLRPAHLDRRDEAMDELTKQGLALGDMVRETGLGLTHTATGASDAFTKSMYGKGAQRPHQHRRRKMTVPAFSVLPGSGPYANKMANELKQALGMSKPVPQTNVKGEEKPKEEEVASKPNPEKQKVETAERMEKLQRRQ